MKNWKGFLSLVMAGLAYASFGIWIRLLSRELTDLQQMIFRYFFAVVFALIAIGILKQRLSFAKARPLPLITYVVAFPIELYLFMVAALRIKLSTMIFAFYGASLVFSLILGIVLFKEKLTVLKGISLLLTLVGFIFLGYPFSQVLSVGFLAAVGSGILDAVVNSARKDLGGKVDRFPLILIQSAAAMIAMLALLVLNRQEILPSVSPTSWLISVIFGLLIIAVNYLVLVGFRNFDLNLGTILLSSEMIFTPIFALIAFSEMPALQVIIGGVFIAASIVLVNFSEPASKTALQRRKS
jgi:drug/metabolite transporter (DMT)-like permease